MKEKEGSGQLPLATCDLDLPIALRKGTRACTQRPLYPPISYKGPNKRVVKKKKANLERTTQNVDATQSAPMSIADFSTEISSTSPSLPIAETPKTSSAGETAADEMDKDPLQEDDTGMEEQPVDTLNDKDVNKAETTKLSEDDASLAGDTAADEMDEDALREDDKEKEEQAVDTLNDEHVNKAETTKLGENDAEKNREVDDVLKDQECALTEDLDTVKENEEAAILNEEVEAVDTNQDVANVTDKAFSVENRSHASVQLQQIKEMAEAGILMAGKARKFAEAGLKISDNVREIAEAQLELAGDVRELLHSLCLQIK